MNNSIDKEGVKALLQKAIAETEENKKVNQKELDTLLVTVTGGAFGVSITLFTAVADKLTFIPLLLTIWGLLGITLVAQIFNYIRCIGNDTDFTKTGLKYSKKDIDDYTWLTYLGLYGEKNKNVNKLNGYIAWAAIISIILLVTYGIINVVHIQKIKTENKPATINNLYFQIEK